MPALSEQFAVVTGAGSGIGKAIAQALGAHGAMVALVGRTKAKLDATAASFDTDWPRSVVLPVDLCVDEQLDSLKAEVGQRFGQVDVLVLCAGEIAHGPIESATVADFDKLYRANVRANYCLLQNLLPMLRKRPGQIVLINSSVGVSARPNSGQFSATQHALRGLTDALRDEVNPDGIRVLSVYPGRVATPRQEKLYTKRGSDYRPDLLLQPADIASVVLNALILPRSAEVTEISIRPLAKSY
jgi:NADP-dependent 3-hydroxy acid dehydrogenase YdfG